MSAACAAGVYLKHYWMQINADTLASGVDMLAFGIAVNMGVGLARQFLAQTVDLLPTARVQRLVKSYFSFSIPTRRNGDSPTAPWILVLPGVVAMLRKAPDSARRPRRSVCALVRP